MRKNAPKATAATTTGNNVQTPTIVGEVLQLNEYNVVYAWFNYARSKEDDPRLKSLMESHPPAFDHLNNILTLNLENHLQATIFQEEQKKIFNYFKVIFPEVVFTLTYHVDETKEAIDAYTPAAKWKELVKHNPVLLKLQERLKLDID